MSQQFLDTYLDGLVHELEEFMSLWNCSLRCAYQVLKNDRNEFNVALICFNYFTFSACFNFYKH